MNYPWHLYVMAFFYILAGLNHFRTPALYLKIIPPYLRYPNALNIISGSAEIILGVLLLIPATTTTAAWGIITLLVAVFPANIYMYHNKKAGLGIPKALLLLRLPLQFAFGYWAYLYTSN